MTTAQPAGPGASNNPVPQPPYNPTVSIAGLPKAMLLAQLYNYTKPHPGPDMLVSKGFLRLDEAQEFLAENYEFTEGELPPKRLSFTKVFGRPIYTDLTDSVADFARYDHEFGVKNQGRMAVEDLVKQLEEMAKREAKMKEREAQRAAKAGESQDPGEIPLPASVQQLKDEFAKHHTHGCGSGCNHKH